MPIVINELVFKGEIADPTSADQERSSARRQRPAPNLNKLVEACVEEVMRILERKKER